MKFREVVAAVPPGLECSFKVPEDGDREHEFVLVLSVRGCYPHGSLGNPHGRYIARKALEGVFAFDPGSLVVDLSEMTYEWGNTLLLLFQVVSDYWDTPGEPSFPVLVVTSDQNRSALRSLLGASDLLFDRIEDAVAAARVRAQAWLEH